MTALSSPLTQLHFQTEKYKPDGCLHIILISLLCNLKKHIQYIGLVPYFLIDDYEQALASFSIFVQLQSGTYQLSVGQPNEEEFAMKFCHISLILI